MTRKFITTTAITTLAALSLSACGGAAESDAPADEASSTEAAAPAADRTPASEIDFGTDGGDWANDNECDDPRFAGEGMTSTPLLDADIKADATDCKKAYEDGKLELK